MFAVGHFALGYITSKTSATVLRTKLNLPLIFTLSIIPDADILHPAFTHRGPTHSIIIAFIIFTPLFAIYRKRAIPYFIALIQHFLISDYIAGGGVQILWPLTTQTYGIIMDIKSPTNITLEWALFLTSIAIMLKAKDTSALLQPNRSNLILAIPTFTVLLPTFLAFPLEVPLSLIPPHIAYLALFLASILACVKGALTKKQPPTQPNQRNAKPQVKTVLTDHYPNSQH